MDAARLDLDEHVLVLGDLRAVGEVVIDAVVPVMYEFIFTATSSRLGQKRCALVLPLCTPLPCPVRFGLVRSLKNPMRLDAPIVRS